MSKLIENITIVRIGSVNRINARLRYFRINAAKSSTKEPRVGNFERSSD
jgi:hypothetical protein